MSGSSADLSEPTDIHHHHQHRHCHLLQAQRLRKELPSSALKELFDDSNILFWTTVNTLQLIEVTPVTSTSLQRTQHLSFTVITIKLYWYWKLNQTSTFFRGLHSYRPYNDFVKCTKLKWSQRQVVTLQSFEHFMA